MGIPAQVIDDNAMRLLVLIGERRSLGAAARELGMAQSNASRALARYERVTGLHLVDRTPAGSTLTEDGRLVAAWAAEALLALDEYAGAVTSLAHEAGTHLSVGASQTIAEYLAPRWLARFHRDYPDVEVTLTVANSQDTLAALEAGRVDIGFIETPLPVRHARVNLLATDELALVVAPGHPWAGRARPVSARELAGTGLVVRETGSGTRGTLDALLRDYPRADPELEVSSNAAVVGSVAAGVAPGVLSRLVVDVPLRTGMLVEVPTNGVDLRRPLRVVWPDAPMHSPATDFLAVAQANVPSASSGRPGQQNFPRDVK
ncbi:LysR family transcriptional regulator [Corynebacterium guangdongense]|uniref:DNA-binding transcriptional LysR family regulator n=1 Tax=Corynebacterium guangdongense TaxID=1783348 RepID=A0ABU2A014_9CORY|nr:LysR family transcriptional regulator [Corynebacterium guangdongense]MDR7330526.1 DNA-binding transcriptional LysR family regulator [Corynebacterium guangdongense]